jgi:hypothetical protein
MVRQTFQPARCGYTLRVINIRNITIQYLMWVSTNITFQVAKLVSDVEDVDQIREELEQEVRQNEAKETKRAVYSISARRRQSASPTGTASCSESSLRQRRQETMKAASAIHGGSSSSMEPATIGMVDTQEKRSGKKDLLMAIEKSGKMKKNILPQIYKDLVKFESSNENMIRSIAVYYNSGVMGKDKYRSVYRASSYKQVVNTKRAVCVKVANCPTPRLVPYHRLMSYIKSIDIGKLHNVCQLLCDGLEESEKVNGCYREIEELLLKLAEFYLNSDQYNVINFDEPNTFHIALGGDGAPFGKDDSACSWLISFLNIGHIILSSKENYLLFGGNCSENCLPVGLFQNFCQILIGHIMKTTYSVLCKGQPVSVKFVISKLPNDMKMLAFLGGELTNSATFFSMFADVSKDNLVQETLTHGNHGSIQRELRIPRQLKTTN